MVVGHSSPPVLALGRWRQKRSHRTSVQFWLQVRNPASGQLLNETPAASLQPPASTRARAQQRGSGIWSVPVIPSLGGSQEDPLPPKFQARPCLERKRKELERQLNPRECLLLLRRARVRGSLELQCSLRLSQALEHTPWPRIKRGRERRCAAVFVVPPTMCVLCLCRGR